MSSERQIIKRLLEGVEDTEHPTPEKDLDEAEFVSGGNTYKCAFGRYYKNDEPISREEYINAKYAVDGLLPKSSGSKSTSNKSAKGMSESDVDKLVGPWTEKSGDEELDKAYGKTRVTNAAYRKASSDLQVYARKLENEMRKEKGIPSVGKRMSVADQERFDKDIRDIRNQVKQDPGYKDLTKALNKSIRNFANATASLKGTLKDAKSRGVKYPHEYYVASTEWDDYD